MTAHLLLLVVCLHLVRKDQAFLTEKVISRQFFSQCKAENIYLMHLYRGSCVASAAYIQ